MKNVWVVATKLVSEIEECVKSVLVGTEAAGLSLSEISVLHTLHKKDVQNPKDLARSIAKPRTSFTPLLDGLEIHGLVTRKPDPDDRRAILVSLTEKGRGLQYAIDEAITASSAAFSGYEIKVE